MKGIPVTKRSGGRSLAFLLMLLAIASPFGSPPARAAGPRYSVADLGTLGGSQSFAYAISDPGLVVGLSRIPGDGNTHAFLYRKGSLIDLSPLNSGDVQTVGPTSINNAGLIASGTVVGGIYVPALFNSKTGAITLLGSLGGITDFGFSGVATGVNNHGDAVGYSYVDSLNRHAFFYRGGVMTDLGPVLGPYDGYSYATGINDTGTVVGAASATATGFAHAFVYEHGSVVEIDPFGGPNNEGSALGVSNSGHVVGEAVVSSGDARHAFLYRKGKAIDLGTLAGGNNSVGYSVNERGEVAGIADRPYPSTCLDVDLGIDVPCIEYRQVAAIYVGGRLMDLNDLLDSGSSGWNLTWAVGINNRGQVVGYGVRGGQFRAFLLTPRG
jgi:probable HAF family extracellular repeat protein